MPSFRQSITDSLRGDMNVHNVLNPDLYIALKRTFGVVKIANEGMPYRSIKVPVGSRGYTEKIVHPGEEYRVNCPYCGDTKQRLYINHRWRTKDEETGRPGWLHLANCFNESCDTFDLHMRIKLFASKRFKTVKVEQEKMEFKEVEFPGDCVPIARLPKDHPACLYLAGRRFYPKEIASLWDVRFCLRCPESPDYHYKLVENRIIIPIYWEGQMLGWQTRTIDPAYKGRAKYYIRPGTPKRCVVYNGTRASRFKVMVMVEGVTDAWRVGPRAFALFGKTLSTFQQEWLFKQRKDTVLINLLDPEVFDAVADESFYNKYRMKSFPGDYYEIRLPDGEDPGSVSSEFLKGVIHDKTGIKITEDE